mgnify:CR=1 FL=1
MKVKYYLLFLLISMSLFAQKQVETKIDVKKNKIGAQFNLTYKTTVDTASKVVFPTLKNFGKMKIYENNVLVLEIDTYGILKKKDFYNKDNMNNIKIVEATTESGFKKNTFIYSFMSSMRQKINDPLGTRAKKRNEISQR